MATTSAQAHMADLHRWQAPPVWRLLSHGTHFAGRHSNTTWRGLAQLHDSHEPGLPVIVKVMPNNETLAAELACALAAKALRLQVPDGVLVLAEKDQLPGLPRRYTGAGTDRVLCFGSAYQFPDDTTVRPTNEAAVEEWVWQQLCGSKQGPAGGVWDELVANNDRHCDNVVFDGARWWLIDHEHTLPPVAKVMKRFAQTVARQTVLNYQSPENTLAKEMHVRRPNNHGMLDLPATFAPLKQRITWLAEQAQSWVTGIKEIDTVLIYTHIYLRAIELRMAPLALHLASRLAQPEGDSLWNFSNAPTSVSSRPNTQRPPV